MSKNRKADAINIGSKTHDHFADNQKWFSKSNSTTSLDSLASQIERLMGPGKIVRCYRCFSCHRHFAVSKMSTAIVICKGCSSQLQARGSRASQNELDRITNSLRIFLRGKLEVV